MSDDARDRLKEALLCAGELDGAERQAFLAGLREEDPAVAAEVESLLGQRTREELDGAGLAKLVEGAAAAMSAEAAAENAPGGGRRLGVYTLVELIGTGGMGAVYRARQEQPIRREVAVKLLRGGLDPAKVLARFEGERRALALVDHPGIARILDAGADEHGTPYLVMELVRGAPITAYCREKRIPPRDLLALFISVCRAVQHAHQKAIIHRDLKPSNILVHEVDGKPVAKIIDFGIARVVEEDGRPQTLLTGEGQIVGTLEYMSPEQAAGRSREIDTRTDVYSLGAVLYELLTGSLPHDLSGKSLAEAIETIRKEPPRPFRHTTSERRPDSDLETIVRKALETEPSRRYDGPGPLADDLERYLRSEPILARPPSTIYQLRKLVSRHRTAYAVGIGTFLFLLAFGITMSVLYAGQRRERERAERERVAAEHEAAKSKAVTDFMTDLLISTDPTAQGKDVTVRTAVGQTVATMAQRFHDQPEVLATLEYNIGALSRGLGDLARSDSLLRASAVHLSALYGTHDPATLSAISELGNTLRASDKLAAADSVARLYIKLRSESSPEVQAQTGGGEILLGLIAMSRSSFRDAARSFEVTLADERAKAAPDSFEIGRCFGYVGAAYGQWGRPREAIANCEQALACFRSTGALASQNAAAAWSDMSVAEGSLGMNERAIQHARAALAGMIASAGREQTISGRYMNNLAILLGNQRQYTEAESLRAASERVIAHVRGPRSGPVSSTLYAEGALQEGRGRLREAIASYREGVGIAGSADSPDNPRTLRMAASLASVRAESGFPAGGEEACRRAALITRELNGDDCLFTASAFGDLGVFCLRFASRDSAEIYLRRAVDTYTRLAPNSVEAVAYSCGLQICRAHKSGGADVDLLLGRDGPHLVASRGNTVLRRRVLMEVVRLCRDCGRDADAWRFEEAIHELALDQSVRAHRRSAARAAPAVSHE